LLDYSWLNPATSRWLNPNHNSSAAASFSAKGQPALDFCRHLPAALRGRVLSMNLPNQVRCSPHLHTRSLARSFNLRGPTVHSQRS